MIDKERALKLQRALFKDTVSHLGSVAKGSNDALDKFVQQLIRNLEDGSPSPLLISNIGKSAAAANKSRRIAHEKQVSFLVRCVTELMQLQSNTEIQKELTDFISTARDKTEPGDIGSWLLGRYAHLHSKTISAVANQANGDRTLDAGNIEQLFEDESLDQLPAFSTVGQSIEIILAELLSDLDVPESAEQDLKDAKHILAEGLDWYELAAFLEKLSSVVTATTTRDQEQYEQFLQLVNHQLLGISGSADSVNETTFALMKNGEAFGTNLQLDMESLSEKANNAECLDQLQRSVSSHIACVVDQLEQHQAAQSSLRSEYRETLALMQDKIDSLEESAKEAREELEVQQRARNIDSLTKLPNREAYDNRLDMEYERWNRNGTMFSLVVADIDYFKKVNDELGHLAGDKVLRVVAKTIRKRLRRIDFVGRYGGEEFVLILPSTTAQQALHLVDDLRRKINECPFHYNQKPLKISVSFGIAEINANDSMESLFVRADKALYAAKNGGRNRCIIGELDSVA